MVTAWLKNVSYPPLLIACASPWRRLLNCRLEWDCSRGASILGSEQQFCSGFVILIATLDCGFFWLKPCKDLKMKDQHAKTSADVNWCSSSQARGAPPAYGVPGQLQTCSGRLFRPNPSHLCSIFTVNSICKSWGAAQPVLLEKKS